MIQWIAVAIILAICLLYIARAISRRISRRHDPCRGCSDPTGCPGCAIKKRNKR